MQTALYTYSDTISHLADWCGSTTGDAQTLRRMKRAVEASYREIANTRRWSYYMGRGRLNTVASYSTGTIAYTNSTQTVTLTSGTFPSWANVGVMQILGVEYMVISATSTTLVLSINSNPGADIAAGTAYRLWKDTYTLPVDFVELGAIKDANKNITLQYIEPNDFIAMRMFNMNTSQPHMYTLTSDPHFIGAMAIRMFPAPDSIYQYDYMYHRRPRPLGNPQYNTGTITSSGTGLTGASTVWTSSMLGCVIRNSVNGTSLPTGTDGSNPYVNQRILSTWTNATSATLDQAFDADIATGVKYEISDPIDLEAGAMYTAFLRKCELELGTIQRRQDVNILQSNYYMALQEAMEADNRSFDRKPEGTRYWRRVPQYYDISNTSN